MQKIKYYSLSNILDRDAHYNMIIGERSNGKTYAVLKYGLERYIKYGEQMGIVRRWRDDFTGKRGATLFDALVKNGEVSTISNGEWSNIYYFGGRWYLSKTDEDGNTVKDDTPLAYGFSVSGGEHDKSTSYPMITTIMFDEFITRTAYLPDEFVLFMNILSTIIRLRDNVKIFMLGNTVNKYCPYFAEMGISHIKEMKPGTIDVYQYGTSKLKVAVEFTDNHNKDKPSNVYFAFDNPKLSMITGRGDIWEIAIYPHKPCKFKPKDILFTFFIVFNGDILQCEVVGIDGMQFVFIHRKTTELKEPEKDLIYTPDFDPRPNWRRKITAPIYPVEQKIALLFKSDKVFYQDNEVGEIVRNYLLWCKRGG